MPEPLMFVYALLAVTGGAWAISKDTIADPLRDKVWSWGWRAMQLTESEGVGTVVFNKDGRKAAAWRWVWRLLDCPFCTGTWLCIFATAALMGWDVFSVAWWLTFWALRGGLVVLLAVVSRLMRD